MLIVFAVLGALVVFAIAAVLVGGETFRLRTTGATAVFDLDEAVVFVAEHLADDTAAGLTLDEVRALLRFSLDHLRTKGLTAMPGEELPVPSDGGDQPVVVADQDAVAVVLGRADDAGLDVTDDSVLEVLDLLLLHLIEIGAVGPPA